MTGKLKPWMAAAIIAVLFGIVSEMDYQEELHREQAAQANQVHKYAGR